MRTLLYCAILSCVGAAALSIIPSQTDAKIAAPVPDIVGKSADALKEHRRLKNGKAEGFKISKSKKDDLGRTHTKFVQLENGIAVWGGEAIVHADGAGTVYGVTDDFLDGVEVVNVERLTAQEAVMITVRAFGVADELTSEPTVDRWIH